MVRYGLILVLLLAGFASSAQVMEGTVIDLETENTVGGVSIVNKHNGNKVSSDKDGRFSITARAGDTVLFSHVAYRDVQEVMTYTLGVKYKTIILSGRSQHLRETQIVGHTKYYQDSTARRSEYGHELTRAPVPPPKYTGLGCAGCVGWLADKITGNSKVHNRFKKEFAADEKSKFIDSRYTFDLVSTLTGIRDTDSLAAFVYAYPMPYEFARAANDLEIKIWIRDNFKQYRQMPDLGNERHGRKTSQK